MGTFPTRLNRVGTMVTPTWPHNDEMFNHIKKRKIENVEELRTALRSKINFKIFQISNPTIVEHSRGLTILDMREFFSPDDAYELFTELWRLDIQSPGSKP